MLRRLTPRVRAKGGTTRNHALITFYEARFHLNVNLRDPFRRFSRNFGDSSPDGGYRDCIVNRYFPLFLLYNGSTLPRSYPTLYTPDVNLRKNKTNARYVFLLCMNVGAGNTLSTPRNQLATLARLSLLAKPSLNHLEHFYELGPKSRKNPPFLDVFDNHRSLTPLPT
ncbi:hypothetical protein TcasGA2_TC000670 [Tribolium castaneum]|uniref:Uncharacterized protein n=1 Tax=Tribolium castaneum TaxID=7070 RepID=D6W8Y7_TRICA|nr:hypothetical protein TcasGA2_TC000670 [Tribolium castaneum]